MASVTHTFVNPTTDWTQTDVDAAIARGELPAGSLAANMTKPSHWNAEHTVSDIVNADISAAAAIDASKIADGTVSNAEFQYINSLTSNAQTQIDAKQATLSGAALTAVTVAGTDKVLIQDVSDSDNLKTVTAQSIADLSPSLGDGDKGDITVSSSGTVWTIDNSAVTLAKQADVATSTVFYRKTAGTGAPEVNTLATLKTDLGLTGTNSGDQTITLTGAVTGSGTGSFATTLASGIDATKIADGTVTSAEFQYINTLSSNAQTQIDGKTSAAVVPSTAPSAGQILVGNAGGTAYAPVSASGAFTLASTGAATIATPGTLTVSSSNSTATAHTHAITSSSAPGAAASILATDSSGIIGSTGTRIVKGWFTDLTVTNSIAGSITGTAAVATTATVANEAADTTCFPTFVTAATGDLGPKSNAALTFNASTANLGCTTFTGALSGNATTATALATPRTIGGVSFDGSANIVPQTIQSINEATDTTCFPLFISASGTQSLQPLNNTALTFNSNTGLLSATSLGGTLTTASQTNITGVGTITTGTWNATDIAVADGGTGRSTSTTAYGLIAAGTTATGAHQTLAAGATTEILVGGGASALPVWTTASGTGAPLRTGTPTITTPVLTGLPTGSGVSATATVSTLASRDSNGNSGFNNALEGYATTPTAGATTTLTVDSKADQYFTGTLTQTVTLPVTSTLTLGHTFTIDNASTGAVTVNSSGGNAVLVLAGGTSAMVSCILTSGTDAASWKATYLADAVTSGKKLSVSNTLTLAGTDATTMTFPTTSATIARTDAANTFTGHQTIEGVTSTGATGTGKFVFDTAPTFVTGITTPKITFNSTSGVIGTTTNDSAAAGSVGEYVESSIASGSAVSLTTTVAANVTSISLTAGDWDVQADMHLTAGATTVTAYTIAAINTTSATLPTAPAGGRVNWGDANAVTGNVLPSLTTGITRLSLSGTTTVYFVGYGQFTVSTLAAWGIIRARRVR